MRAWVWVGLTVMVGTACGDTVVDEGEGEGGGSSTTSSGTLTTPTGTTSGVGTPSGTGGSTSTGTGTGDIDCDQFCAECECTCGDTVATKIGNFCDEFEDDQCNEAGDTWECETVSQWMTSCEDEC